MQPLTGSSEPGSERAEPSAVRKPRWRTWLPRVVLGLVGIALGAWLALNAVHDDVPVPLWGADELPALPPPERNGWAVLQSRQGLFDGVDATLIEQALGESLAQPPGSSPPAPEQFAAARAQLATPAVAQAWAVCAEAFARPEFVDGCPIELEHRCPALDLLECHLLGSLQVLDAAAHHDWHGAADRLATLLAQAGAHARTARSTLGLMVALRASRQAVALARRVSSWAAPAGAEASLAPVRARLKALGEDPLNLRSAIIGEYVLELSGIERIHRGELDGGGGALPRFFFDPGATLAELNRIYQRVAAAPAQPAVVPDIPAVGYTKRGWWWVRNPIGKLYLDSVLPPPQLFPHVLEERAALIEERTGLLAALEASPCSP